MHPVRASSRIVASPLNHARLARERMSVNGARWCQTSLACVQVTVIRRSPPEVSHKGTPARGSVCARARLLEQLRRRLHASARREDGDDRDVHVEASVRCGWLCLRAERRPGRTYARSIADDGDILEGIALRGGCPPCFRRRTSHARRTRGLHSPISVKKTSSTSRKPRAARLVSCPPPALCSPSVSSGVHRRPLPSPGNHNQAPTATGSFGTGRSSRRLSSARSRGSRSGRVPTMRSRCFVLRREHGRSRSEREGVRHVSCRARARDGVEVEARLRAGQEDRLQASPRRPDESGADVRVEAAADGRRLPVHSEREGRLPDVRSYRDAGHFFEGR